MKFSIVVLMFLAFINVKAQLYSTGLLTDKNPPKDIKIHEFETLGFGEKLADSISLREFAPFPGNQGQFGTCVGWAYGYCAMSILYAQEFNITNRNVITAIAMCPFTLYNQIKEASDQSCKYGTYMHLAPKALKKKGTKRNNIKQISCGESLKKDTTLQVFKVSDYSTLWDEYLYKNKADSIKILNTKKALNEKKPVIIGFNTTESFMNNVSKKTGLWEINSAKLWKTGGHAMCVVGYNDKMFGGAFEIQNSWGRDFGKDGYCWVKYADFAKYTYNAYVIEIKKAQKTAVSSENTKCEFGDCKNRYSRFHFDNGDVYEGELKNSKPNGMGIYQFSTGDVYAGQFVNGVREGIGTVYFTDGTRKKGLWQGDSLSTTNGNYFDFTFGAIAADNGEFLGYHKDEEWIYGIYSFTSYGQTETYYGKFTKDRKLNDFGFKANSYGAYIGDVEDNSFKNYYASFNLLSQKIKIIQHSDSSFKYIENKKSLEKNIKIPIEPKADSLATNDKVKCQFGDCENGYGKYKYTSGNSYEGYFVNGRRHGYGVYEFKINDKLNKIDGVFQNNHKAEICKITMPDGIFYGYFDKSIRNGYGLYITTEGSAFAGAWENDKLMNWGQDEDEAGFASKFDRNDAKNAQFKEINSKKNKLPNSNKELK